jgi:hypothetical protein
MNTELANRKLESLWNYSKRLELGRFRLLRLRRRIDREFWWTCFTSRKRFLIDPFRWQCLRWVDPPWPSDPELRPLGVDIENMIESRSTTGREIAAHLALLLGADEPRVNRLLDLDKHA